MGTWGLGFNACMEQGVGLVGCDCHRESVDPGTAKDSPTSESDLKHLEYESRVGTNGWYNEIGSVELGTWEVRDRYVETMGDWARRCSGGKEVGPQAIRWKLRTTLRKWNTCRASVPGRCLNGLLD